MQIKIIFLIFILLAVISAGNSHAQKPSSRSKHTSVKTSEDIPHKTVWQKLIWVHRSAVLKITKERPVKYDTAYIRSFYKRLVITIPFSTRFLDFSLIDLKSGPESSVTDFL